MRTLLSRTGATAVVIVVMSSIAGGQRGTVQAPPLAETLGWPMMISPEAVVVSAVFSAGVGLVFGYYPARHASAFEPIDALRAE
jgi:putative ABC transport system permease protein